MLKNKRNGKKFREIIMILIAVIAILGFYIKGIYTYSQKIGNKTIKTIGIEQINHMNATTGAGNGTINPIYKPKWTKVSSELDTSAGTLKVTVKGNASESQTVNGTNISYSSTVTSALKASDILVYIDGELDGDKNKNGVIDSGETPSITKEVSAASPSSTSTEITQTITLSNFVENARQSGRPFTEWSGNVSIKIKGRGKAESTYTTNVLTDKYGNESMMETDQGSSDGSWVNVVIKDGNVSQNTSGVMFADLIKPEFTYEYANTTIDHDNKKVTLVFDVTDKYFNTSTLSASNITVKLDGVEVPVANKSLSKKTISADSVVGNITYKANGDIYYTVNGTSTKVGERYQLEASSLDKGNGNDYSGIMTVAFPANAVKDKSGNGNVAKTITVGVDDPTTGDGHNSGVIVDVVSPYWSIASSDPDTGVIKIRVSDKYLTKASSKFELTKDKIKILVNGTESTAIVKTLTGPTEITANKVYEYTLTLSNLEPSGGGYTEFTPIDAIVGGTAKYRNENGGAIVLRMLAGTITDQYGNKTKQQDLTVGNVDITEPEIYFVQKTGDVANNKETVIFNVTDKNYNEEDPITVDEMTIWINGTQVDSQITKKITKSVAIKTTIDGKTRVVGHQYTLEIGSIAETDTEFINSNRAYRELSGPLEIRINKDAASDLRGNTLNEDTTTIKGTTDVIRPEVKYQYATSNINKSDKTFTMVFEMVDKYYKESASTTLTINDLTIKIDNEVPDWNEVTRSFTSENVSATVNGTSKVIGKRYTLKLSNLEQLQVKDGDNYLDYSGVITVGIPANKMADETGNKNIAKTITSGVNIPGGTGSGQVVDVVAPLIEKESTSANAVNKTATVKFKVTDKYFKASTITKDNIKVFVNGTETTSGITKTLSSTELKEDRVSGSTTTSVQYGIEYTLTVTGFATNADQVKIQIPAGLVTDNYSNSNIATEIILYNVLKTTYTGTYSETNSESKTTAGFLGNTAIQRQNIDNITFVNSIAGANSTKWNVAARGDSSILAWYTTNANGSVKVYIGSDYEIFANQNSTDLFAYIGYSTKCTSTGTITNMDLLNVTYVTNMYRMFRYTGYNAMTTLTLGSKFSTSNVTNMSAMFEGTGYKAMTTLTLGSGFNTSKVTNMAYMFSGTGHDKLTSLNLGSNFNTSLVTDMKYMFNQTGYTAMTTLTLGANFDTSKVTDMQYMFAGTGHTAMTSLDLGSKFNTSLVTNMNNMFNGTGYTAMTSLNLGSQFNTSKVTNMNSMFEGTGYTAMTSLNLGTLFDTSAVTTMNKMFYQTGHEKMTTLTLGSNFNTSKVTDMSYMFSETGMKVMTALDLGDKFYTTAATNMSNMFNACGQTAMTGLDLGPAFTKIADTNTNIFTNTGKSGTVIYAPESIYKNRTAFKKGSTDTSTSISVSTGRTVNPIYRPEWTKTGSALKPSASAPTSLEVTVKGNASKTQTANGVNINYNSNVTLDLTAADITVYINGVQDGDRNGNGVIDSGETPSIKVAVAAGSNATEKKITLSNLEEATRQLDSTGKLKKFSEWSGNISIKIGGRENATSTYTVKSLTDSYGNQSMSSTDETGSWVDVIYKDADLDGDKAKNTDGTMFTDFIKPEFTYEYSETTIDHDTKTVTVIFDVADKYFSSSDLTSDTTASKIALSVGGKTPTNATKALSKVSDLTATVNGTSVKVGERYKLVVTNLDQNDGDKYSGVMTMSFAAGLIKDKSGNGNVAKTITIGIDDPTTGDGDNSSQIVDVVSPFWRVQNTKVDAANKKVTTELVVTDKYLTGAANSTLTTNNITVAVDGDTNANTAITKTLSTAAYSTNSTTGLKEIKYTLTLSNFEQASKQSGKSFLEYSGTTKITIAAGVVTDQYTNKSKEQSFTLGHVDFIKPRVEKVSSTRDATAKTETIRFNVIDKYLDTTKLLTADNIKVFVDGEEATNLTKTLTRVTANDTSATVNGTAQTVSQQYQLVLSNFEKVRNAKNYKDWSGTVTIEVATNVVKDKVVTSGTDATGKITSGGNTSDATTLKGDFVDFIKPDLKYVHQSADINKDGKTYTMTFTVTDKYYRTGKLTIDDLVIKMQNGQKDSSGNEIIYNLKDEPVTMTLQDTELRAANVPITNTSGNVETVASLLIGHTYKLTISNLEQLERKAGLTTADYSGIVTVAVAGNKELDRGPAGDNANSNGNVATTITSGVNIPGGTSPDDAKVVDVVDPIWEKISSSASAIDPANKASSTATIKFKGTDTYFASSNLTADKIKVLVNGTEATGISKTLSTATELKESRKEFGKTTTVTKQYGVEYTLTLTGFVQNADQVKIQLPAGTILDESGNGNKVTEMIVYNVLKKTYTGTYSDTNSESKTTAGFLGNTAIQRQNIDNITFVNGIADANDTKWDVSARGDNSILAWYTTNGNGSVKVYIGSDDEIFANQDSTDLFAFVGYSDKCTSTENITNINLLNVTGVTSMYRMFRSTGYNAMTKLDLGSKFDTSNVTNMKSMFENTGYKAMTTLTLGANFDTNKVTDMSYMFASTGYTAMTSLNLGSKFNSAKVTDMNNMFNSTGYTAMTTLTLGANFDTSKVTDMKYMFYQTGYTKMTSLDLGSKFNTSLVTDMNNMFNGAGYTAMTTLTLGGNFNTVKVTNMNSMFEATGYTAMTSLNLGTLFDTSAVTTMNKMFYQTGHEKMTTLTLGDNFNTSKVTNMAYMFSETGLKLMTALDLGDKFYTTAATDMGHMFENVGQTLMTSLDLGPAFTKIASTNTNMFVGTGKSGAITIYASEQIYLDKNNLKLDTNATSSAINYTRGTINPKYRTEWVRESSTISTANKNISITLRGRTNADAGVDFTSNVTSSLTTSNIHVYFNGEEATTITKSLANATTTKNAVTGANDVLQVLTLSNLEETARQQGKDYKEWSGNISLKIDKKTLTDETYKNQNLKAIDTTGQMIDIELKDASIDKNTNGTMFTDYINPEFTYVYSNGNINYTDKTLTVEFSITDKYFNTSTVLSNVDNIAVKLIDTDPNTIIPNENITKELTKTADINKDIDGDGKTEKVGEKYKLVIKGLEQKTADGNYKNYSGPMSISIPAGVATDKSGNTNIAQTITIGVNEPGGSSGDQVIVDVVDPLWKTDNINIDHTNKKVTVDLIGTDKYYASNSLTTDSIKVSIDGENVTTTANVQKSLSAATPLTETRNGKTVTYGVKYTLTLSNWEETEKQNGKQFFEWSGTTKIEIAADTLKDESNNTSNIQTFTLGHADFIQPKVEKVSSTKDSTAKTETIIFNVIDKYLDTSDLVTTDEISVYVDNELVPKEQIKRTLTKESDLTAMVNGTSKVIGHQYKLVLSEFEQTRTVVNYNREYSDWSGTVSIKVAAGAVKDTNTPTPNKNVETTLVGDFIDFIKPNATYQYTASNIDYDGKTFTMVFDVTDKYYTSGTLAIGDLDIKIDGETPNWDDTGVHGVVKELTSTDRTNTVSYTDNGVVKSGTKVIGKRYTLKLSHLEQLEKLVGKETMDYSGVITVAIPKDKLVDTSSNKNNAVTITSGLEVKGEPVTGDGTIVDVVDPIWERVSSSASAANQTATITVKGTDKYFKNSSLTADKIKVIVNGQEVSSNVSINVGTATPVYASNGTTRIGDQYTITVSGSGLPKDTNQIRVQIQPNAITDNSGNTNKVTDLLVYNALIKTDTEAEATSGFLGSASSTNAKVKTIQRQNIDNVTFVDNIPSTVYDKSAQAYVDSTAWDVSAMQDKSILAWYTTNANGTLKVYIGSDNEIFGNYDSSYLFKYIGYSGLCTSTETITNINLLNVGSVNDMSWMFGFTGWTSMTKLDLGSKFDTSNVTNMRTMFGETGRKSMTTLNLGANFNTSNVTDMAWMFCLTGTNAMTSLDLGGKFDTSKVTNMKNMFEQTGRGAMTTLSLGANFDTSKVTTMSSMFKETGYTAMTSLDLGSKFNTSQVTDMNNMFNSTGYTAMTSLKLGSQFNTVKVTNMNSMFEATGYTAMTSLNLETLFDTSAVTTMNKMFYQTGHEKMETLTLGDKFNTSLVTDMSYMFSETGLKVMTELDLGDKFYTTAATDMSNMFNACGQTTMTSLDLGPAFTKIASTHTDMFVGTGKSGAVTIYASEQIYLDKNNFKIDTNATSSAINYTRGTINPKYRTEWVRESSTISTANKNISITLRGRTNADAGVDFTSNVTSSLTIDNIHLFVDGEEATTITKTLANATTTKNAVTGANDVLQVLTLSNLEETLRQQGKNFKEWSGNISLKIDKKTLTDETYKNQNLQAIDTTGEMLDIVLIDTATDKNTNGTMFTDYIKPEFTYEYYNTETDTDANTIIGDGNHGGSKKVTVVFDVTDKYFKQANITADSMTIKVGGEEPDWTKSTKTLTKKTIAADKVVGDITYKANGDIYYTVNGTSTKIGERYELVVTNLETQNGVGYSGAMTMSFPAGQLNSEGTLKTGIVDKSGNLNLDKTITIGIDEPENTEHPNHNTEEIVDVVNPLWTGPHNVNSIDRTNKTVDVKILGSDKYYATDVFAEALTKGTINTALNKIKVYVDDVEQTSITKTLTKITSNTELQALIAKSDLQSANAEDVKVGYTLTLGNFGELNGETKIVIEAGTITDNSGNKNIETTIPVGNVIWVEANEPLKESDTGYPRYHAFRDDIVDFIKPVIKYKYSAVEGDTTKSNPEIDYEAKTLTVKFTVTDKYLVGSSVMNANGTLNTNNVRIRISTLNNSGVEEFKDITDEGISTAITSAKITDGYEYTLVIKDFEQIYNNKGQYMDYSGIVQLVFAEGQIDDISGNKNVATTITLDTGTGDNPSGGIIVDVIDPIIERTDANLSIVNTDNTINRDKENETGTVTVRIKATDKYLATGTLQNAENVAKIKVKVIKPDGTEVMPDTITKSVRQISKQSTSIVYELTLGNFETNEGVTSVIIPADVIKDTSGNGNRETEVLVGNSTWTETGDTKGEYSAFKNSIVDFTMPVWKYATSSITRNRDGETGTVKVKILGSDIYYLKDTLTTDNISVYVANSETPDAPITTITKSLEKITNRADLEGADTGYYLTLGNFGTYDGQVKIAIAADTMKDTSGNGNKLTEMLVGNPNWVEKDIGDSETSPKYTAFRDSIVDFIKPTIKYQYTADTNPIVDQENKKFTMTFDAIDTNFLESAITLNDIQILVDDVDVTDTLTKNLTSADIADGSANGIRYTLTLSDFELEKILEEDSFKRHSGKIELVIASGKVKDTSGNENIETRIIVDNDNGDDADNYIRVDFIKPKLYYVDKHISWDNRYATVTIAGTDRFYDFNTVLDPKDITIYQKNLAGEYVQVTNLPISIKSVKTEYGYNFVIRLDDFEEEYKMKISIPAGKIADLDGHYNDATDIIVDLDNKKPIWKYVSTDTSQFESDGKLSFNVKGQDKFLDLTNSGLEDGEVSVYRDGVDISEIAGITINYQGQDETEKSKSYKIDVTGLTEIGTYSLVFKEKTLIDEFDNESATTTITFSKSIISSNTDNYQKVTYHASPDFEQSHQAYVHELMSVNTTGTNAETTTFRPSTIGEIYDDGKNTLFAEPFTYTNGTQSAYSFKGWALANENGFIVDKNGNILKTSEGSVFDETKATIYGLYDEIPDSAKANDDMVHLRAVWQKAKVIFVSNGSGNNSADGLSPTTPVKDLQTAYSKLGNTGKASENIIVIMDKVEWNNNTKLTGNATITSLYAGVDYEADGAELKISSNLEVEGDIKFDNIKLYSNSTSVSDGSDYLANGSYTNMLITNYGDVTLGRRISTPDGKYTFGAVIGGNYKTEATVGEIGVHTVIVEAGKYNNIVAGSSLGTGGQTTKQKYISQQILIGNMKDAAISRNDKLTITGALLMGELEDKCYAYNTSGSQDTANAQSRTYSVTKLYSGTFTGENKFAKASEEASMYLRPMNGFADGIVKFEMYGGDITGNVYAGTRMATTSAEQDDNILKFYGGNITGNIFGHGSNDTSTGNSNIELAGRFTITGNVFGGSNATTIAQGKVTGNTTITISTASATVDGNIYGGSNGKVDGTSVNINNGLITGNTNVVIKAGKVTGDIFGGGYNCGVTNSSNITIENGTVVGSIYGGSYQNQVRTEANINIVGGTVNAIYGGNVLTTQTQQNEDASKQSTNITIDGDATINGAIYGSGKYDVVGKVTINLIQCATVPTVYGGSEGPGLTEEVNINLEGMTAGTIYGGTNGIGTVTTANINLKSGTVTDVYGGGYGGTTKTSKVNLGVTETETVIGNATVTSIYGGPNLAGKVETSNVTLKSGTVTNVFGGGNSAAVDTANVLLDGITIDTIHGGSKDSKVTANTNVVLKSGKVTNAYAGGLGTITTNAKITQQGADVENIYGGGHGGTGDGGVTTNSTVNIDSSKAINVYGGSMSKGITKYSTINIRGTSLITGKIYGGGYRSDIGKSGDTGTTTINISGGTINKDIYGGSESGVVYGTTNINVGADAVTDKSPVAGHIIIKGNIYGGGTSSSTNYSYTGVYGNTHITLDNSPLSSITFNKSIFGSGKGSVYSTNNTDADASTVKIKDFGTSTNSYKMISIQRTGKVYIGHSYLELTGAQDNYNYYKNTMYTLNRVTKGLALHDGATLYTRRGFNMVGGFESFLTKADGSTTKETISISGDTVTKNVDNRLYTFEGINLIFAKQEGELSDKANQDIWGDVNGMAFFGMYRISRTTLEKEYDIYAPEYKGGAKEKFFANGTYIEGRHKANHNTSIDGFYTNIADYTDPNNVEVLPKVIEVTDYGTYYDWIIGEDIVNYDVGPLIASTYSTWSEAELKLDYKYQQGAIYTVNRISANALDENINLVNSSDIETIASSDVANNTFALTMEAEKTGWIQNGVTNMYTDENGSFDGNKVYRTDNSSDPGTIIFKIFNSINVSETKDLGNINVILTGKTRSGEDASAGNIFRVVIAVSLQSLYEEPKDQYTPRFTDSTETELNYTTDSSIDISYILYKTGLTDTIYTSGDYRTLSSTVQLPAGTRIKMRDYGQGDNENKVYYYQIGSNTAYDSTETVDGKTRYVYKLSHFENIGTNTSDFSGTGDYANSNSSYYHSGTDGNGYAFEKYDISIDFMDANINANQLAQEIYLQLRSADGTVKYNNGEKTLGYNLYNNNATMSQSISNEGQAYSVFENLSIPFTFDATLLEKIVGAGGTVGEADSTATSANRIHDTKYYDKKVGLAIEIVDEVGKRAKAPELQNFKLTSATDSTVSYIAGDDGVIRVPLADGLAKLRDNYTLSLSQYNVPAGTYKARIYFFSSDDGLHYGGETTLLKEIQITFINKLLGLAGVDGTNDSRIINKTTGLNLEGNDGLDLTVTVGSPTDDTNIRVELYKRNPTYTVTESESGTKSETYNGTQYTQVDLKQYLEGDWETPEDQGLVSSEGSIEYMFMPKETYDSFVASKTAEFKKAIKKGISTGEYKILFKTYFDNTLIQTVTKTFVVSP